METGNSKIKRLVATDKKFHEAPVFIAPKEDPSTQRIKDYKSRLPEPLAEKVTISLEPKRDRDDNVIDELMIQLTHLKVFDLNNANDALLFEIVMEDPMIALSKDKVNPDKHRFYIEDKEAEATVLISKSKLKKTAFEIISSLSMEQMINYARILGKYTQQLSHTQVESALYEIADNNPQQILDVNEDKDLKHRIFLRRLIERGQIHIDAGKYMNGKDLIGVNEEYAILWLKDPENSRIITQWYAMLEGAERPAVVSEMTQPEPGASQGQKVDPLPTPEPTQEVVDEDPDPTTEEILAEENGTVVNTEEEGGDPDENTNKEETE